ncbi:DEAD/DEAH box helicase [Hydrogenobacter hydrogenophilus]|uniref:Helicase n=1 Tax=Hydrogenobacter hydrogenophilus TaxID=35835 RepID=A0A285NRR7_9AQUI|nr:DEAD/DEAH box helicase [Hydrogenobacter hydrogenophilus]SNZ12210.1 helicase [Hydrogenobacter hydrogenophilus]
MGKTLILLKESQYQLKPPGGKLLFSTHEDLKAQELPLVSSEEVDHRIPYPLLNPLQSLFFYYYQSGNALVCAPTSAGKSLIAYLFMRNKEGRKVYTAPTKSLVYEKAVELRRYYSVDVRTGDSILESYKRVKGEVVVSTYENLVYALRNSAEWVQEISCIVFDEIHQLTKRWILEEAIAYALDRDIKLLGLSATLPSYEEIADWIRADLTIYSHWRPVALIRDTRPLKDLPKTKKHTDRDYQIAERLLSALFELSKRDEKVILFVPQKKLGWKLLELAKEEKIGIMNKTTPFEHQQDKEPEIAFHNADVPKEEREEIEKAFREGSLNKLVATQTLAYGVNLPADRVIILVRMFHERGKLRCIPDTLDILQMEGRAGRLGIKEVGYSHILTYGGTPEKLEKEVSKALKEPIQSSINLEALSLFVLLGFLYEGGNYENFLTKTFSYRKVKKENLKTVMEFLISKGYINKGKLTPKAIYCVRSGIPPTHFEEFLRRLSLNMDHLITLRPLLHMKKFDSLYEFVKNGESFIEDYHYVAGKLSLCGQKCLADNTDQFIFYTEGLTFKYPNISSPPGEFSYLGTDALHLLRMLMELSKLGVWRLNPQEMLSIAHSVKYGLTIEYASLSGIKGIGHIRANLLKRVLQEDGILPPPIGSKTSDLLDLLDMQTLGSRLEQILREQRKLEKNRAKEEAKKVIKLLENNKNGLLVDDRILLAFGLFKLGEKAYRLKKKELAQIIFLHETFTQ